LFSGSSIVLLSGNIGNSAETGLEFGAGYKSDHGLRLDMNYTYADIADKQPGSQPQVSPAPMTLSGANSTPVHKINLHGGYSLGLWEFDGYGHYGLFAESCG
jgi:hypothetical protein